MTLQKEVAFSFMIETNVFINLFLCPIPRWFTFSSCRVLCSTSQPFEAWEHSVLRSAKPSFKRLPTPRQNHQVSPLQSSFSFQTRAGGVRCTLRAQTAMRAFYRARLVLPPLPSSACCSLFLPFSRLSLPVWAPDCSRRP